MSQAEIRRILLVSFSVVPSADRQGVELENVIKALAPRFQVDVLSIRTADMGYVERYRRTRMFRVPVGGGTRQDQVETFRRAVRRQIEGAEYDLVHFRSAYGGLPICQMKSYLECKLIFELAITSSSEGGSFDDPLTKTLIQDEKYCIKEADLLIAGHPTAAKAVRALGGARLVAVVPPGVDIDTFDWEPSAPHALRQIAYIGTLGPARGIGVLLEGFKDLLSYTEARLLLAGPVEEAYAQPLNDTIAELQLTDQIDRLGTVPHDEIPRILASADVCVVPGTPDPGRQPLSGIPLNLLEYLACRRPAIAPDQPVLREALGKETVKYFEPGNPADLASAMLQLLADPPLCERLARRGYEYTRENYSASSTRRALLTAYSQIVPSGHSLWGYGQDRIPPRQDSAETTARRFRDTVPLSDVAVSFNVTPTGGIPAHVPQDAEEWVIMTPDTVAQKRDEAISPQDEEPQFTAAGELLGSRESAPPDTNPGNPAHETKPDPPSGKGQKP